MSAPVVAPEADARTLSVNAVNVGRDIVLATLSPVLRGMLEERGYRVHDVPITDFSLSTGNRTGATF